MTDMLQIAAVGSSVERRNFVPNPQFGSGLYNGWSWTYPYMSIDAWPPVALPANCAAAACFAPPNTALRNIVGDYLDVMPDGAGSICASCYVYRPGGYGFTVEADLWDGAAATTVQLPLHEGNPTIGFARYAVSDATPGIIQALFRVKFIDNDIGRDAWLTGFMIDANDHVLSYGDGDTYGWTWTGVAHNSSSYSVAGSQIFHVGRDDDALFIYAGTPGAPQFEIARTDDYLQIGALPGEAGGGD